MPYTLFSLSVPSFLSFPLFLSSAAFSSSAAKKISAAKLEEIKTYYPKTRMREKNKKKLGIGKSETYVLSLFHPSLCRLFIPSTASWADSLSSHLLRCLILLYRIWTFIHQVHCSPRAPSMANSCSTRAASMEQIHVTWSRRMREANPVGRCISRWAALWCSPDRRIGPSWP